MHWSEKNHVDSAASQFGLREALGMLPTLRLEVARAQMQESSDEFANEASLTCQRQ